jgi:hypothetical protein
MAIHQKVETMAIEVIDEYLAIAEYCVNTPKPGGDGVYGYPAVLLLFSVLDAFSDYRGYPRHSFRALRDFQPRLSNTQVTQLSKWFRHPLSHQAVIMAGTKLSMEEGEPFEFAGDEPVHIRVRPFFQLVKKAWQQFLAESKISVKFHPASRPQNPLNVKVDVTASGASGFNVDGH